MNDENDGKKRFTVVDKRFWADGEDGETLGEEKEQQESKPTYVRELELKLEQQRKQMEQFVAENSKANEELSNARQRIRKDVAKEYELKRRSILVEFLDVLDNLDRALEAGEQTATAESLLKGVAMVRDLFVAKLQALGVIKMEILGNPFDPAAHEAMSISKAGNPGDDGKVVGVLREGYTIGEDILRPAGVAVARYQVT